MNEQILSLWVLKPVFSLSFLPAFFCLSSFSLLSLVSASRHPSRTFFLGLAVGQRPSSFPKGTGLGCPHREMVHLASLVGLYPRDPGSLPVQSSQPKRLTRSLAELDLQNPDCAPGNPFFLQTPESWNPRFP